jgi:hypothetical protein
LRGTWGFGQPKYLGQYKLLKHLKVVDLAQDVSRHATAVDKLPPMIQRGTFGPDSHRQVGDAATAPSIRHLAEHLHGATVYEVRLQEPLWIVHSGCWQIVAYILLPQDFGKGKLKNQKSN